MPEIDLDRVAHSAPTLLSLSNGELQCLQCDQVDATARSKASTVPNRETGIRSLGLPPKIQDLLLSLDAPSPFEDYFKSPDSFFAQGEWPQFPDRSLLPLWEHGGHIFAIDLASSPPEFIEFDRETRGECDSHGSQVYLPILHILFLHVLEYGGGPEELEEAIEFARSIDFPHCKLLEEVLDPERPWSEEAYEGLKLALNQA
jgi:hypothetical protein